METEKHVLFECNRYGEERVRWRGVIQMKDDMHAFIYIYIYIFIILNAPTFCPNCTIVGAFRICIIKIDSLVLFAPVSS